MKSPSATSSMEITLADPPAGTPTAAAVNHTVNGLPADSSARADTRSCSVNAFGATIVRTSSLLDSAALCPGGPTGPPAADVQRVMIAEEQLHVDH
jgi:hypothetical protein